MMGGGLRAVDIARKRIIEDFQLSKGRGIIQADGKRFEIQFDDLLDLTQAIEMIMLKLTGKVLRPHLRPPIRNRAALKVTCVRGGDCGEYDGKMGAAPFPATQLCDVTHHLITTHYLLVEMNGNRWDNWFGRLDELVKCLYAIVREAQGDPYIPRSAVSQAVSRAIH